MIELRTGEGVGLVPSMKRSFTNNTKRFNTSLCITYSVLASCKCVYLFVRVGRAIKNTNANILAT